MNNKQIHKFILIRHLKNLIFHENSVLSVCILKIGIFHSEVSSEIKEIPDDNL